MAGIYIHIPFCAQACHYCDFHFSTNLKNTEEMVKALCREIQIRSNYINEPVKTIYFGGGTPSLLRIDLLSKILNQVNKRFQIVDNPEITLEANPEDLTREKSKELLNLGINRLSIGFQTFNDDGLKWMNRVHDSQVAKGSYANARSAGFDNISIDLIYALPHSDIESWNSDLITAIELEPEHLSLYGLTIEDKTVFGKRKREGNLLELPKEKAADQYLQAILMCRDLGYDHYEVSNFAKIGFRSRHNTAYWNGEFYLGIGPGAHSYNGNSRQFNIRNNVKYINALSEGTIFFEVEDLTKTQLLNEYLLTRLRTTQGISIATIKEQFNIDLLSIYQEKIDKYLQHGLLNVSNNSINLTSKGFLVADDIALQLFFEE